MALVDSTQKPKIVLVLGDPELAVDATSGSSVPTIFANCAAFQVNYALNSIPTATVTLAARGINMYTGQTAPDGNMFVVDESIPANLYLSFVTPSFGDPNDPLLFSPERTEAYLLFSGEYAGLSQTLGTDNASYVVHLRHVLSYLNCTAAISSTSHPGNLGDYAYPASAQTAGGGANSADVSRTWVYQPDANLVSQEGLKDLWTNIFAKWLAALASNDPFDNSLTNLAASGVGLNTPLRLKILETLSRVTVPKDCPLDLNVNAASMDAILSNILGILRGQGTTDVLQTTLWGKIIGEWAPEFLFELSPFANGALIIPNVGALAYTANTRANFLTIDNRNIVDLQMHTSLEQELQAYIVTHSSKSSTGFTAQAEASKANFSGAFGFFRPARKTTGIVHIKRPPRWLDGYRLPAAEQMEQRAQHVFVTAVDPKVGGVPASPTPAAVQATAKPALINIANKYAKQCYFNERLKNCTAQLTIPLRFDMAPGAYVKVLNNRRGENSFYTGKISQVSCILGADKAVAGTTLVLTHARKGSSTDEGLESPTLYPKVYNGRTSADWSRDTGLARRINFDYGSVANPNSGLLPGIKVSKAVEKALGIKTT